MLEGGCSKRSLCWACMPFSWDLWTKTHSQTYLLTLSGTKIRAVALKNWHFERIWVKAHVRKRVFLLKGSFFFFFHFNRAIIYPGEWLCEPAPQGPLTLIFLMLHFPVCIEESKMSQTDKEENHVWFLWGWPLGLRSPNVDFTFRSQQRWSFRMLFIHILQSDTPPSLYSMLSCKKKKTKKCYVTVLFSF